PRRAAFARTRPQNLGGSPVDSDRPARHKALAVAGRFARRAIAHLPRSMAPAQYGGVPEWLKGTDCKSVGYAYVGSNPTPSTTAHRKPSAAGFPARGGLDRGCGRLRAGPADDAVNHMRSCLFTPFRLAGSILPHQGDFLVWAGSP